MIEASCGEPGGQAARRNAVARKASDALALAASPTFAVMALLSGVPEGGHAEMPGAAHHASALSGMVTMYVLMSVFHAAPWLRLFRAGTPTAPP
jgi:hypothetical protein